MTAELSRKLNALGLLAICGVLAVAFADQLIDGDLPCPLCLLQRVGFVAVGFGLCLNVLHGPRPQHYAVMILAALFGGAAAVRQVLLHIVPGSGSYGDPLLGLQYYTWAALVFSLIVLGAAAMLLFDRQFDAAGAPARRFGGQRLAMIAFAAMLLLSAGNGVSAYLQCGLAVCADDPTGYRTLSLPDGAG